MNFWVGVLVGIIVSAVGFSGIAALADHGVATIQNQAKTLTQGATQ